jgi:hypothetical protein
MATTEMPLRVALWPARETWRVARRVERGAVGVGAQVALRGLDAVLRSPYADDAVRRVAESHLTEHGVEWALAAGVPQRIAEGLLANGLVERVAVRVLEGPELDRIVAHALETPDAERLIARVMTSAVVEDASARLVEDIINRLRESPALWRLIDEVAQSPAVLDAIAQQSAGLADQVSDELRERTRTADDRLERAAWRLFRRHPDTAPTTRPA